MVTRCALFAALFLFILTVPARAGTVEYRAAEHALVFEAEPGEENDLFVQSGDGVSFTVTDAGAPLTSGTGCSGSTCTANDPNLKFVFDLGDEDDKIWVILLQSGDRCVVPEINGESGNDHLQSTQLMRCSNISQDLDGGPGDDLLIGGSEYEHLDGGAGHDTLVSGERVINLREGAEAGPGTVWGMPHLFKHFEVVLAGDGPNRIIGTGDDETLNGGEGDDVIEGGAGADTIVGGTGNDYVSYANHTEPVTVRLGVSAPAGGGSDGAGDNLSGIEHALGGRGNDTLFGDAGDNWLNGGHGADLIDGGAGSDWVSYSERNDTLEIRLEDAPVSGSAFDGPVGARDILRGIENVEGGWGRDWIYLNDVPNVVDSGQALDVVYARGGGVDTIDCGDDRLDTVHVDVQDRLTACEIVHLPEPVTEVPAEETPKLITPAPVPRPAALTVALTQGKLPALSRALAAGVPVTGTCSAACRLRAELKVDAAAAKKLGFKKATTLATGTAAASGRVTLRFTRAAKRALKRARQLKATLSVTATGADGKVAVARRTVTLKR